MKARVQRTSVPISLAHDTAAYPGQIEQIEACADTVARVNAQLQARSEATARIARVKTLKAQVNAGTYIIDSRSMAQKMWALLALCPLAEHKANDIAHTIQKDERHE